MRGLRTAVKQDCSSWSGIQRPSYQTHLGNITFTNIGAVAPARPTKSTSVAQGLHSFSESMDDSNADCQVRVIHLGNKLEIINLSKGQKEYLS